MRVKNPFWLALTFLPVVVSAAAVSSMQINVSGQPGPRNNNCYTNCIKTFRENGQLKIFALDNKGRVFKVETTSLPDSAKRLSSDRNSNKLSHAKRNPNENTPHGGKPDEEKFYKQKSKDGQVHKIHTKTYRDRFRIRDHVKVVENTEVYRDGKFVNLITSHYTIPLGHYDPPERQS